MTTAAQRWVDDLQRSMDPLDAALLRDIEEVRGETFSPPPTPMPWVSELCDALSWRLTCYFSLGVKGHINIKEAKPRRTLIRHLSKRANCHNKRHLLIMDSLVVLSASAKGRSSSTHLRSVVASTIPDLLTCGIYLGGLHVSSPQNPLDDPSRRRPLRVGSLIPHPLWLQELWEGRHVEWDRVCDLNVFPMLNASPDGA